MTKPTASCRRIDQLARSQFFTQLNRQLKPKKQILGRFGLSGSSSKPQIIPANIPRPLLVIGDKVADCWRNEFGEECREFGVVVGICWHPNNCRWEYLIEWTGGSSFEGLYPCFDGQLIASIAGCRLIRIE